MALTADASLTHVPTVAVSFVRLLTDHAVQHGLHVPDLMTEAGLPPDSLRDNDARLDFPAFDRLCRLVAERLADPMLGLHLGRQIKPGHYGSHGFGMISCTTVGELLQHSLRYSGLVMDVCRNELVMGETEVIRYWRSNLPDKAAVGCLQDELNMAAWVTLARWTTGQAEAKPLWVSFRHAAPVDLQEYDALFACPLHFDAAETAIAFDPRWLAQGLPQANPAVRLMMDNLCAQQLARLRAAQEPEWLRDCKQHIVRGFEDGVPELESVAERLGMSGRELQRQLAGRQLNFRDLVDGLRGLLAKDYLRDSRLSLVDVAFLLGFSEQSAFQRAFKRWTGMTPMSFRAMNSRGPTAPG